MLKTEKILNSYGLTFGEAEELLQIDVLTSLMQAKDKGGDQLALQVATLDERVAEYLNSAAIKTILEENRKEAIGEDEIDLDIDLKDFDLDLDDLDSAKGFDVRVVDLGDIEIDLKDLDDGETDDEGDEETPSSPPPMVTTPKPSPKEKGMASAIVFENVPATNFFSQIVKNKVPEVDSDGALVVKFGDLRVRALLDETFVRLGAMPLNSADFRVEVVSMDAEKVVEYDGMFGAGQAQKMEKGVLSLATEEVSQVFNTQQYLVGGAEINTSFDGITTILKKANLKDEFDLGLLDFPLGKAVHPLMVWRSNYFIEPKTLYALANCDEFFSASVGGYRYITNYCEANDLKQLRIFEIGGPHLNIPFDDTRGETITNSVIQDDFSVFSGRVGGIIGDTYSRNEVLYEVGFTQVLPKDIQYDKVDSLSERAGYFVFGSPNSARTFYIPAVVYNYFKKFYGVDEVLAGMKPNSGLFTLYFRKGLDIQGFIMIDESNAPSSAPARLLPTDAVEYVEEIVGMNAVAFTDKINIEEDESVTFLGEVRSRPDDGLQRVFEEQIALFEQALEFMDEGEDDVEIATLKEAIEGARIMLEDDIDEQAEEEILESIDMISEEEDELGQVAVANDQDILPTPSADDPVVEEIIEQEKEDVLEADEVKARKKVRLTFSFNPSNLPVDDAVEMVEKYTKDWRTFGDISETTISANLNFDDAEDLIPELPDGYVYDVQIFEKDTDGKEVLIFGKPEVVEDDEDDDDELDLDFDDDDDIEINEIDLDFAKGGKTHGSLVFEKVDFPALEKEGIQRHKAQGNEHTFFIHEYVTDEAKKEYADGEFGGNVHLFLRDKDGKEVDYIRFLEDYNDAVKFANLQNSGVIGIGRGRYAEGGKTMDDKVSDKIRLLRKEGKPQDQAVAIALSMRDKGKLEDGGLMAKGGKTMTPSDIVSLLTDREVAQKLAEKMMESLESLEYGEMTEQDMVKEAMQDIRHSRKMLTEILTYEA